MKKWIEILLAAILCLTLLGCEEAETFTSKEDRVRALNGQETLTMRGDFEEANQASDIFAGGISAARFRESGLLDPKWTVELEGKPWITVKYVTDGPVYEQEGIIAASTIGYFDENGDCLGYAQEQVVDSGVYHWIFLDPDLSKTGLWAAEDGTQLYDGDTLLARGTADYSYSSAHCDFTIDCVGGRDVPFFPKFAMYMELYDQAKRIHG